MFEMRRRLSTNDYMRLDEACELLTRIAVRPWSPEHLLRAYGGRQLTVFWNFSRPNVKAEYAPAGLGESSEVILPNGLYALMLVTEEFAEYGELAGVPTSRQLHSFADEYYSLDDLRLDELEDFDELGTQIILRLPEQADEILAESWSLNPVGFRVIDGYSPIWPSPEELLLSRREITRLIDALAEKIAATDAAQGEHGREAHRRIGDLADCGSVLGAARRPATLSRDDRETEAAGMVGRKIRQKNEEIHGMNMYNEIRPDMHSVSQYLHRFMQYRAVFHRHNVEDWSHLNNNEDFYKVYELDRSAIGIFEAIYRDGRDLAVSMSRKLGEFNDAGEYPTLKSYVDSFLGGWVYQVPQLRSTADEAKNKASELQHNTPWAVGKMIQLFETQIEMLVQVGNALEHLRQSDLYREESGFRKSNVDLYEKILSCIHDTGKMLERTPSAYIGRGEEALRDHILVTLGGALNGNAIGEGFNNQGKTDILVRIAGNNEFIGECKFWGGEDVHLSAIDQVFRYLGWRDNKAAVIVFVDNKKFDPVIDKIKECTERHANFSAFVGQREETWFNYEFKTPDNPERVVQLAVMAYHLPK